MDSLAQEYQAKAAKYFELAKRVQDPELLRTIYEVAIKWLTLAAEPKGGKNDRPPLTRTTAESGRNGNSDFSAKHRITGVISVSYTSFLS